MISSGAGGALLAPRGPPTRHRKLARTQPAASPTTATTNPTTTTTTTTTSTNSTRSIYNSNNRSAKTASSATSRWPAASSWQLPMLLLTVLLCLAPPTSGQPDAKSQLPPPPPPPPSPAKLLQQEDTTNRLLELELNNILQQHGELDENNKQLADEIIARLMLDNLTVAPTEQETEGAELATDEAELAAAAADTNRPLGRLLAALSQRQQSPALLAGQFPLMPSSQLVTMKRAAAKMGNYLAQHRALQSLGRNNQFEFGLGKRPDGTNSQLVGNILRFGDSAEALQLQPLGQFGKRPAGSHRYDFGLGKRVANPAYQRYDFGLGKRAPNRVRYDFGLGRK